jgi:hypothetical protein
MIKLLLIVLISLTSINAFAQTEIYKYTDKDGNVHYSDQKPYEGAKQQNFKPLTIIKSVETEPVSNWRRSRHKEKFKEFKFNNFEITSPLNNEALWGTAGKINASVFINGELPSKYRIKFFLDELPQEKIKTNSQLITEIERGEHTLYATVIEAATKKTIKTTPKITFHIKQHSKK